MNFEKWFKDYRFQDGYSKGGACDAWNFQQGRIRDLQKWFQSQIDYIPEYYKAVENCEEPCESLKRVLSDNLRIYFEKNIDE